MIQVKAHRVSDAEIDGVRIQPGHPQREWIDLTPMPVPPGKDKDSGGKGFAKRCLPLLIANQLGWDIVTEFQYTIVSKTNGQFDFQWTDERGRPNVSAPQNNFSANLCTWALPWVFETPPGWDMLVMPVPNWPMPRGVAVVSGVVETDHSPASFTLNWRVDPETQVWVQRGDPIARIVPYPTDALEGSSIEYDEEVPEGFPAWSAARAEATRCTNENPAFWQKDYWNAAKRRNLKIKKA